MNSNRLKPNWNDIINAEVGRQKLTRAAIQLKTGLSHPTVKAVLDNEQGVSLDRILDIAGLLGVSVMREGL